MYSSEQLYSFVSISPFRPYVHTQLIYFPTPKFHGFGFDILKRLVSMNNVETSVKEVDDMVDEQMESNVERRAN